VYGRRPRAFDLVIRLSCHTTLRADSDRRKGRNTCTPGWSWPPTPSGLPRLGGQVTLTLVVLVSLPGMVSPAVALTVAVSERFDPLAAVTCPTMVMLAVEAAGIEPRAQVTFFACRAQLPWLALTEVSSRRLPISASLPTGRACRCLRYAGSWLSSRVRSLADPGCNGSDGGLAGRQTGSHEVIHLGGEAAVVVPVAACAAAPGRMEIVVAVHEQSVQPGQARQDRAVVAGRAATLRPAAERRE
jgi:hypothetical protein